MSLCDRILGKGEHFGVVITGFLLKSGELVANRGVWKVVRFPAVA